MTVTLKAGTRPLTLGTVTSLSYVPSSRAVGIDQPSSRGASRQDLGSLVDEIVLNGVLDPSTAISDFQQLNRYRMLGRSLKLNSTDLDTVVWLDQATYKKRRVSGHVEYQLRLLESKFKPLSTCDELTGWGAEGGAVTLEDSDPVPVEGDYCIKVSGESDYFDVSFEAESPGVDLTYYDYFALSLHIDGLQDVNCVVVHIFGDDGETSKDATSQIAAGQWNRILIHKTEFPDGEDPMDWGRFYKVDVEVYLNGERTLTFCVDDVGVYE